MRIRRHRDVATRLLAAGALAAVAVAPSGCGDADQAASGTSRAVPPPVAAPPATAGGGAGAFAAPRRIARERRRFEAEIFEAEMDEACQRVSVPAGGSAAEDDSRARAQRLLREQQWLRALRARLSDVRAPRAQSDRERARAYRRAVANQILLDGIVARGLLAGDNPLGVDAGDHQNFENRRTRARIADELHSDCLRGFTVDN